MSNKNEIDEIITVTDEVEKGYFYLENRQFQGPFKDSDEAITAALSNCEMKSQGECRAVYQGSVRVNRETNLREPMADMHQIEVEASLV